MRREREKPRDWEKGAARHSQFHPVLRLDRILNKWPEHYQVLQSKGYKVEGKTPEPPIYYRLECGIDAADLEVGRSYKVAVAVAPDGWTRILVFFDIRPDPKATGMSCGIESERTAAR